MLKHAALLRAILDAEPDILGNRHTRVECPARSADPALADPSVYLRTIPSRSEILQSKPIGKGLDGFRDTYISNFEGVDNEGNVR